MIAASLLSIECGRKGHARPTTREVDACTCGSGFGRQWMSGTENSLAFRQRLRQAAVRGIQIAKAGLQGSSKLKNSSKMIWLVRGTRFLVDGDCLIRVLERKRQAAHACLCSCQARKRPPDKRVIRSETTSPNNQRAFLKRQSSGKLSARRCHLGERVKSARDKRVI